MSLSNMAKLIILFIVAVSFISCRGVSYSEVHLIEINHYDRQVENEKLAEEIFNYGPEYIMGNIPSYTEDMSTGIKIGYSLPTAADKNPNFQYTLKLNVPAVAKNKERLKSEFEEFIPKLVKTHVSKKRLYDRYAPRAEKWLLSVFNDPLDSVYLDTSSEFKASATEDEFIALAKRYKSALGMPTQTDFISGYYVENNEEVGEILVIMFSQKFAGGVTSKSQIIYTKEESGAWGVSGYKIIPQT